MYSFNSRAVRALMGGMVFALAACVDEPTEPRFDALRPSFGLGDVMTVTNTSGGTAVGSLRWALSQMQGGEVIRFDPSLAGQTIVLDTTIIIREKSFTLEGPGDKGITISGGGRVRVFDLDGVPGNQMVLRNLTIANGNVGAGSRGAGIFVRGYPEATLRVENSTLTGHVAGSHPALDGNTTVLVNTTVSGNTVLPGSVPLATLQSENLTLVNSTIAHNAGAGVGGGNVVLRNSILSNHGGLPNCLNVPTNMTYEGSNVSDDSSCGTVFDLTIGDPVLGPLADNGGPAMTHALLAGSPAINSGANCSVTVDQRYAPRDAQCDIGAFEFVDFTSVDLTVASAATFDKNGWAVLSGSVRCSRNETFDLHVTLQQIQKNGRAEPVDIHAVATTPISCTTGVLPWSIALVSTDGPFENADATASLMTMNTRKWVTPAAVTQTVKMVKGRK